MFTLCCGNCTCVRRERRRGSNTSVWLEVEMIQILKDLFIAYYNYNNNYYYYNDHLSLHRGCSFKDTKTHTHTFSGMVVLEGHRWVDLPRVHAHPAARVGQDLALRLPVVVSGGHIAARRPAVHPVLVGGRVSTRRHITGQRGGRLRANRQDRMSTAQFRRGGKPYEEQPSRSVNII